MDIANYYHGRRTAYEFLRNQHIQESSGFDPSVQFLNGVLSLSRTRQYVTGAYLLLGKGLPFVAQLTALGIGIFTPHDRFAIGLALIAEAGRGAGELLMRRALDADQRLTQSLIQGAAEGSLDSLVSKQLSAPDLSGD